VIRIGLITSPKVLQAFLNGCMCSRIRRGYLCSVSCSGGKVESTSKKTELNRDLFGMHPANVKCKGTT
jgi:hypothetical protein